MLKWLFRYFSPYKDFLEGKTPQRFHTPAWTVPRAKMLVVYEMELLRCTIVRGLFVRQNKDLQKVTNQRVTELELDVFWYRQKIHVGRQKKVTLGA